jgi:hypothetical protein
MEEGTKPMERTDELLASEEAAWRRLSEQVDRVAGSDRDQAGVVGDWSVQDLVWHCAHWADFCAAHLERVMDGPVGDPFAGGSDEQWDRENDEIAERSKAMSWQDVIAGTDAARSRVRAALSALPEVRDDAAGWFADETITHYDEHAEQIAAFVDGGRS